MYEKDWQRQSDGRAGAFSSAGIGVTPFKRAKIRGIDKTGEVVMESCVDPISLALSILVERKVLIRMCAAKELYEDQDLAW